MKTMRVVLLLVLAVVMARSAAAEEPDAELIAKITGLKPDVKNGIAKVTVPRGDLGRGTPRHGHHEDQQQQHAHRLHDASPFLPIVVIGVRYRPRPGLHRRGPKDRGG